MIVWSYGGGVQTAAIGVLIVEGVLPRPDLTVMADTGREATATWDYLRDVMTPYLARAGVEVKIAPHSLATVDLYAHNGDLLIPAFTAERRLRRNIAAAAGGFLRVRADNQGGPATMTPTHRRPLVGAAAAAKHGEGLP